MTMFPILYVERAAKCTEWVRTAAEKLEGHVAVSAAPDIAAYKVCRLDFCLPNAYAHT